jgi:hypothetical protein
MAKVSDAITRLRDAIRLEEKQKLIAKVNPKPTPKKVLTSDVAPKAAKAAPKKAAKV